MSVPLERAGATVIWRCHIGIDHDNEYSRNAWRCLRPRLTGVRGFVFSRYASLPEWLGGAETSILTPGIDPRSTKNLPMSYGAARAIVQHLGLAAGIPAAAPRYARTDGSMATLAAGPRVVDSDGPPDWGRNPVVVSLARWDRIKDPLGILDGFVERVIPATGAHMLVAGPDPGVPAPPWRDAAALDPGDHDALTGLWNRRRFENELDRARQHAERLALLSIDVDRYNEVIRRHGAAAAEAVIQSIAHVLAQRLRPNDTLARMGGDEFAAVLRAATPSLVQSLADGLCTAVREQSHAVGTSRIPATISIGAAFFDPGTQTHHQALRAADAALHEAKVAGGDRAIVHQSLVVLC
jgi:diguanylate cyclase (GGDEF)-like protein